MFSSTSRPNVLEDPELSYLRKIPPIAETLTIRKAKMGDISAIIQLINSYAAERLMLPRTEFEMSENIRDFTVAYSGAQLLGCGALHFYTPTSGEIRSLAVSPEFRKQGIGVFLMEALENEALNSDLNAIFAFTYVAEFFRKLGFQQVDRGLLPLKVWKDCLSCPKFHCCDEVAVIKALRFDSAPILSLNSSQELVQLPNPKQLDHTPI
jgi:amino-acid N-acetyltransferase